MNWERLPVAPLYADVRTYCSHVKMYCKRVRLLSSHPRLFINSFIHLTANFIEKLWITTTVKPGMYYTSINRGLVITFNKTIVPITAVVKMNNQRKGMNDSLLINRGNVFYGGWCVLRKSNSINSNQWRNPVYFCLWNPQSRKICLWNPESCILGIQLKESGSPLTIGIQNLSSTDKYWNPGPGN